MLMIIRSVIAILLALKAHFLAMRYNMHMFQLNGYKNGEHRAWIKKNLRQQWVLIYAMVLGLVRIAAGYLEYRAQGETASKIAGTVTIILDVLMYLSLLLIIAVYNAMKLLNTKKKLVYTPRVKRMITTNYLVCVCLVAIVSLLLCIKGYSKPVFFAAGGVATIIVGMQLIMNIVTNIINSPIEKMVNQYYINDAINKLKSVKDIKIIGVTGSYGKTSVKFYLNTLLSHRYNVLMTPESFNTPMGVVRTIREHLKPNHEIFICEMGARHVGDIKEICDMVHPHHGVITSVGPQHLETFFNMENIKSTKFELADSLPKNGMLFMNGDNEYIQDKAKEYTESNRIFYHAKTAGDGYKTSDIKVSQLGTSFVVTAPTGESESFAMKLIGEHNVINVVGAIAVAHSMGMSLSELKIPVRRIESVPHRMQLIEHGLVTIIDDAYNSNPVGSRAAVETLALFDGVRILVTPGMVELGDQEEEYNYKFGTYAAACCDYILLVGKKHTEPIMKGVLDSGFEKSKCQAFDNLQDAMAFAYAIKEQKHKYILLENDLPDNY